MNYEKKYLEALEKARQFSEHPLQEDSSSIVEYIFPEIKEDEDEKIRKVLIDYFNRYKEREECGIKTFYGIPTDNILAWLEKQGTSFTKRDVDDTFVEGMAFAKDELEKQCEKPAWSEEDERICRNIINDIANDKSMCKFEISRGICDEQINWLKSIKERVQPQNTWKPSDAQMASITCAVRKMKESACYDSELVSLYQDLKKLKG